MNKLVNFIITFEDGVYTADAVNFNIVTQSEKLDSLLINIKDAMKLYFEDTAVKSPYFSMIYSDNLSSHA